MSRGETLKHYWIIRKSLDHCNMEWWYTSDEVFSGLREKLKD